MTTPVTPYNRQDASKKAQVTEMFDNIAERYDLLNRTLTFGMDVLWRRHAIDLLRPYNPQVIADIATGTGDFAVEAMSLRPKQVIGIDISPEMLRRGEEKMKRKNISHVVSMRLGDSEHLVLEDNSVDAVTVGFGVRNFQDLEKGLSEILRVVRPGGAVVILEPSFPTQFPLKQLFQVYFRVFTPLVGRLVSGDVAAYKYLPESVRAFPNGTVFTDICRKVGFKKAVYKPLTFGSCSLYLLEK